MKGLAWLVRDLDLYQLGFLIWALGALAVMGVIFGIVSSPQGATVRYGALRGSAMRVSNFTRCTLKKLFTLRTFASCVNSRCTSAW